MEFFEDQRMAELDESAFQNAHPYPWVNPAGLLRQDAYETLRQKLPPLDLFETSFGKARRHGQRPHDRYKLAYSPDLPVAQEWHDFAAEVHGPEYRRFLARMIGNDHFDVSCQWHYTPSGCSVSPHCDATWKLGSHLLYFNTEDDWDATWGGETVILDDRGRFSPRSAPEFEDFEQSYGAESLGNRSLLFIRNKNSWHGVRPIACPEGYLRKVFLIVIKRRSMKDRVKNMLAA